MNKNKILLIITSLILIPAFVLGISVIWILLYSLICSFLIRKRLINLHQNISSLNVANFRKSFLAIKGLAIICFENIGLLALTLLITHYIWIYYEYPLFNLDYVAYTLFLSLIFTDLNYQSLPNTGHFIVLSFLIFTFSSILMIFLNAKEYSKVCGFIYYHYRGKPTVNDNLSEYNANYAIYHVLSGFYFYGFLISLFSAPLIFINFLPELITSKLGLISFTLLCASTPILSNLLWGLSSASLDLIFFHEKDKKNNAEKI